MSLLTQPWQLTFGAAYIVHPGKGLEPENVQDKVLGSEISPNAIPTDFFYPLFCEVSQKCPIDVLFSSEAGRQENAVRSLIQSLAFGDASTKANVAHQLAYRLASATTNRSRSGLLVTLVGHSGEHARVVLWKFPADTTLHANVLTDGIAISVLKDAFSRKSTYFKAAFFEDTPASTAFWRGKVEDKQAKYRAKEAAEFWISGFLAAQPALTHSRGTRILARALRETIRQSSSVEAKEALIAAASVIKSQVDRNISLSDFANTYLPESERQCFIKATGVPTLADAIFTIDAATLDTELKFKSIVIDEVFTIRGPLDRFDDLVKVHPIGQDGVVQVSLQGTITSQSILLR